MIVKGISKLKYFYSFMKDNITIWNIFNKGTTMGKGHFMT